MDLSSLTAISPIDGRYNEKTQDLRAIFSEFALIRHRYHIEIEWLLRLSQHDFPDMPMLSEPDIEQLKHWQQSFSLEDAKAVKKIEQETNHDVKAVEYYLREQCANHETLKAIQPFIHLCCTSEDINNLSYAQMLRAGRAQICQRLKEIQTMLQQWTDDTAAIAMIGRTHGQVASPTSMGKEFAIFNHRLHRQIQALKDVTILGKCNGATGNYNAHTIAYPEFDWISFSKNFVTTIGLEWNPLTTQIEPHDYIAQLCHALIQINTVLIDFTRDMWRYISIDYFKQKTVQGEVGSSTMPHKVNPIDFENAEGNLRVSNALLACFAENLPISRWQRDLVDSTILRNLGTAFAHAQIAYLSCCKGISKLELNIEQINTELEQNWSVISEAIQSVMRRYQITDAYEQLKDLTRGKTITQTILIEFIDTLELPDGVKSQLKELTPAKYIGKASNLCRFAPEAE